MRQKSILLGAVPAMDLVDEDHRPASGRFELTARIGHRLAQIRDARTDGANLDELRVDLFGESEAMVVFPSREAPTKSPNEACLPPPSRRVIAGT